MEYLSPRERAQKQQQETADLARANQARKNHDYQTYAVPLITSIGRAAAAGLEPDFYYELVKYQKPFMGKARLPKVLSVEKAWLFPNNFSEHIAVYDGIGTFPCDVAISASLKFGVTGGGNRYGRYSDSINKDIYSTSAPLMGNLRSPVAAQSEINWQKVFNEFNEKLAK